ncbi:MAG: class I SAM-dependent methyltransferase [Patescibacteria group bacterium]|jgi:SAM-dependent methyltransferase
MKKIFCPICGEGKYEDFLDTRDARYSQAGVFKLVKCIQCDMVFLAVIPEGDEWKKFYPDDYWAEEDSFFNNFVINFLLANFLRLIKKYKKYGSVLDVGCGTGRVLEYLASKGWRVWGQEISSVACRQAERRIENVYCGPLKAATYQEKFFDVIILNYVFHQMIDLAEELAQIKKIIKDDGIMVFSIPNVDSRQLTITQRDWFCIDSPRHIYFFSPKTIKRFFEKEGLEIVDISFPLFQLPLDFFHGLTAKYFGNKKGTKYWFLFFPLLVFSLLIKVIPAYRSCMTVACKKQYVE